MNPRVRDVHSTDNFILKIVFDNDEERLFDVKPYLDKGLFIQLRDLRIFNSVKPFLGSIQWSNGLDLCPDTLYLDSKPPDHAPLPLQGLFPSSITCLK